MTRVNKVQWSSLKCKWGVEVTDIYENSHLCRPALKLSDMHGFFKAEFVSSYSWNSSEVTKQVRGEGEQGNRRCFAPYVL